MSTVVLSGFETVVFDRLVICEVFGTELACIVIFADVLHFFGLLDARAVGLACFLFDLAIGQCRSARKRCATTFAEVKVENLAVEYASIGALFDKGGDGGVVARQLAQCSDGFVRLVLVLLVRTLDVFVVHGA